MNNNKFNLIGFSNTTEKGEYKHCVIHKGTRLIQKIESPDMLWCPQCGSSYNVNDANIEQKIIPKFKAVNSGTRIISPKKKKRYYDTMGHEINPDDKDIMENVMRGDKIISYREDKI